MIDDNAETLELAVNGGLMSGLRSNAVMIAAGAGFVRADRTAPHYRLWSIGDQFPGMVRHADGAGISLELWRLPPAGFVKVLQREPPGLSVGKIVLADGSVVLGVLAEPYLCEGQREITDHGGWREYLETLA